MYSYTWDPSTGGLLLNSSPLAFSKEPRPVYYKELDILGFDRYWNYVKNDSYPYMWAEANNYFYRGRLVAKTKGGSLYTPPELVLVEDPEPDGSSLRFVDIPAMVEKNRDILEKLAQDTIKRVYNTFSEYQKKVDIFHVSYSGGKDSEVTLDIIQRALPHNSFVVVFGNTKMEFPDTYEAVRRTEERCKSQEIRFYYASSHFSPMESWRLFGPPSNTIRWCCSVHKTAPQLLKVREIVGKSDFREMAFVGVRQDESLRRSNYTYISKGTKHKGQYSCNPILEWNSAEVYLYLYTQGLQINEAYKKGNSRAGCLVCPMSADKSDFMRHECYPEQVDKYIEIVKETSVKALETEADNQRYIENGGWKLRNNGRDIFCMPEKYFELDNAGITELHIKNPTTDWQAWVKTIGCLSGDHGDYVVEGSRGRVEFSVSGEDDGYCVRVKPNISYQDSGTFKLLKQVFRKSAYCVFCQECVADCARGALSMDETGVHISDNCISCSNCHKPDTGCLLYKSLSLPKGNGKMANNSIDSYADHAPKREWIQDFLKKGNAFFDNNDLGSVMISMFKRFLRDADLVANNKLTDFGYIIQKLGIDEPKAWGLMLSNLAYAPEFNWYIKNVDFFRTYTRDELIGMLKAADVKDRGAKSITGAYKRILALPFGSEIGLGDCVKDGKTYLYTRNTWASPDPVVILYSLYKFAEACGDYYQFTLSRLLDHEVDSDGISPTQIFGLDRETMMKLLNGLTINHPDFINASFTLDLDSITLNPEKTSEDVLSLL